MVDWRHSKGFMRQMQLEALTLIKRIETYEAKNKLERSAQCDSARIEKNVQT